jgi:hypothetical protein
MFRLLLSTLLIGTVYADQKVIFYSNDNFYANGLLGSRQVTNGLCRGIALGLSLACSDARMVVSYSVGDAVKDFPDQMGFNSSTVPIYTKENVLLSDSWDMLLNGGSGALHVSLHDAGVFTNNDNLVDLFYSGSNGEGEFVTGSSACASWTDKTEVDGAMAGGGDSTTAQWLESTTVNCDGVSSNSEAYTNNKILCACLNGYV